MHHNFYYLCGLPRAGNTLLSSLMNQNPDISVTANNVLGGLLVNSQLIKNSDVYQNFPDERSVDNVTKNMFENYHSHWKSKNIISRGVWGMPDNLELLQKFNPNKIKIIVLVRDIKEILASFIKFSYSNETNFIAKNANTLRQRCDYVMANGGELHHWIQSVHNLTKPHNRKFIHLIEYNDLTNDIDKEMNKIYEYLNIKPFDHRYKDLDQLSNNGIQYNDSFIGGELHKINTFKVKKSEYDMNEYLPDNIDELYNMKSFWRQECLV